MPANFLGLPNQLADPQSLRVALFGAGHGSTYPSKDSSPYALAANAIRAASQADAPLIDHWDFNFDGPLFNGGSCCCIDMGDLPTVMRDNECNRALIARRTSDILSAQAVPVLLGGDCSVTIPFLTGFADHGPVWVVQIDAHIDWRDEIEGETQGYSSPMRRASEMSHVAGMVQIGMRSTGSARPEEVEDARRYGSRFVPARDIHNHGVEAALKQIPEGAKIVITLDCDSIDPAIMPGVAARTPGGLTFFQIVDLIAGIGRQAKIAGFNLVEYYPPNDIDDLSALTAAHIVVNALGTIIRQD